MKLQRAVWLSSLAVFSVFGPHGLAQTKGGTSKGTGPAPVKPLIVMCTVIENTCGAPGASADTCKGTCEITKSDGDGCGYADDATSNCFPSDASTPPRSSPGVQPSAPLSCTQVYNGEIAGCPKGNSPSAVQCQQWAQTQLKDCRARAEKAGQASNTPQGCAVVKKQNTDYCGLPSLPGIIRPVCLQKVKEAYTSCMNSNVPTPNKSHPLQQKQ